jgi:hypothetical protein
LWNSLQQEELPCSDVAIIMRCTFVEQKLKFCIDVFALLINGKRGGRRYSEGNGHSCIKQIDSCIFLIFVQ